MLVAGEVTAGLAESNGSLPPGGWLTVTCGLTACTSGSAPGPMLGIKYGKAFTFYLYHVKTTTVLTCLSQDQIGSLNIPNPVNTTTATETWQSLCIHRLAMMSVTFPHRIPHCHTQTVDRSEISWRQSQATWAMCIKMSVILTDVTIKDLLTEQKSARQNWNLIYFFIYTG